MSQLTAMPRLIIFYYMLENIYSYNVECFSRDPSSIITINYLKQSLVEFTNMWYICLLPPALYIDYIYILFSNFYLHFSATQFLIWRSTIKIADVYDLNTIYHNILTAFHDIIVLSKTWLVTGISLWGIRQPPVYCLSLWQGSCIKR